jgi:hypothetical protein
MNYGDNPPFYTVFYCTLPMKRLMAESFWNT